jgi:hypothetical protein
MSVRISCPALLLLAALVVGASPAVAQTITTAPLSMPFPVLAGADFSVDPAAEQAFPLFSVARGALQLRANDAGWVDMNAYCQLPDRHWGPVSVVSSTLEVSGGPSHTGLALPARVPLNDVPMGSTVTLRLLLQAPIIIVDLEGQPSAVLDTFVEEYHWTLRGSASSQPPVAACQ